MSHTPGPWKMSKGRKGFVVGVNGILGGTDSMSHLPTFWEIAHVFNGDPHDGEAAEANARLIAAAPALFEACHSAVSCFIAVQAGVGPTPDIKATLATLRAAIAAAKGKP